MLADEPVKYKYRSAALYELDDTGFRFLTQTKNLFNQFLVGDNTNNELS